MLNYEKHFDKAKTWSLPPNKVIKVTDRNIKVSQAGFIYIAKYIHGAHIRISTNLRATKENIELVKSQVHTYIENALIKKGYMREETRRSPGEYLSESMLYVLNEMANIKQTSFARYKTLTLSIKKALPHKRTNTINKAFLHNYALNLHNKGFSKADIKQKVGFIIRALNNYNAYFNRPPFDPNSINISKYGQEVKEKEIFTEAELGDLLKTAKKDKELYSYLFTAIHTGARVGEILALESSDIDDTGIRITKTKTQNDTTTTPKTKSSIRSIAFLNTDVKSFMHDLRERKSGRLFKMTQLSLRKKWKKLLHELRLKYRPIYNIRHTFATLVLSKSNNILALSHTLGHKNANTTLKIYAQNRYVNLNDMHFDIGV